MTSKKGKRGEEQGEEVNAMWYVLKVELQQQSGESVK